MSMSMGSSGSMSDINVTPMIDILLVLLIIFMVIVPVTPKGLAAMVPQPPKDKTHQNDSERTIVVQILYNGHASPLYKINDTDVSKADLLSRLTDIYANRAERIMFVKGDDKIDFRYVAEVIDIGRSASVDHIGLMTPRILEGQ